MKTKFINDSKFTITLKEGNAGAFRELCTLSKSESHDVEVNPNATYREYMAATGSKGETLVLSEEVYKYDTIRIIDDASQSKMFTFDFGKSRAECGTRSPLLLRFAAIKSWIKSILKPRLGEVGSGKDGSAEDSGGQNLGTSRPDEKSSTLGSGC